jgi:hypothetical protein
LGKTPIKIEALLYTYREKALVPVYPLSYPYEDAPVG